MMCFSFIRYLYSSVYAKQNKKKKKSTLMAYSVLAVIENTTDVQCSLIMVVSCLDSCSPSALHNTAE